MLVASSVVVLDVDLKGSNISDVSLDIKLVGTAEADLTGWLELAKEREENGSVLYKRKQALTE